MNEHRTDVDAPPDWRALRAEFPTLQRFTYLDMARKAILPRVVEDSTASWRLKHRLGGALRQSGVLAAACLHALDHNVERLAEDHANAALFARLAGEIDRIILPFPNPETNIVFLDVARTRQTAPEIAARLKLQGVRLRSIAKSSCER